MKNSDTLKYFVGKICTIFTSPINREFTERQNVDYFVGRVDGFDDKGILMSHVISNCKNYYFFQNVISIAEEQLVDSDDPIVKEYESIKEQKKTKNTQQQRPQQQQLEPQPAQYHEEEVNDSPFVDIAAISDLAKKAKESYK
jgi:hypothetical protein